MLTIRPDPVLRFEADGRSLAVEVVSASCGVQIGRLDARSWRGAYQEPETWTVTTSNLSREGGEWLRRRVTDPGAVGFVYGEAHGTCWIRKLDLSLNAHNLGCSAAITFEVIGRSDAPREPTQAELDARMEIPTGPTPAFKPKVRQVLCSGCGSWFKIPWEDTKIVDAACERCVEARAPKTVDALRGRFRKGT